MEITSFVLAIIFGGVKMCADSCTIFNTLHKSEKPAVYVHKEFNVNKTEVNSEKHIYTLQQNQPEKDEHIIDMRTEQ